MEKPLQAPQDPLDKRGIICKSCKQGLQIERMYQRHKQTGSFRKYLWHRLITLLWEYMKVSNQSDTALSALGGISGPH